MSSLATMPPMISLGETELSRAGAARWLAPVMIGIVTPMILCIVLFPQVLDYAGALIVGALLLVTLLAVVAYGVSVVVPSVVSGVTFNPVSRQVTVVAQGPFTAQSTILNFNEISDLRLVNAYDDDGYAFRICELVLTSGATITVPNAPSVSELEQARLTLGLIAKRR